MDFPNIRGIAIEAAPPLADNPEAVRRSECTASLIHWASMCGFVSRNSVKLCISELGHVKLQAKRFIPANKHILHVPFQTDLSFATLKTEVDSDKNWPGWADLKARIKAFENSFKWHPYNYDRKDNFSKNMLLVTCMMGVLKKIADTDPNSFDKVSDVLKTFSYYWDALPSSVGSVLFDWTEQELGMLKGSSFINCLPDAKRYGFEMFHKVFLPFISQYPDKFIVEIDFGMFMKVNSIVCTRSFGSGKKEKTKLIPVIDLVNGKSNDQHNCSLENCAIQKEIDGEYVKFHSLQSTCDINAGDELFLEYAQVGNGSYLLTYNHIPLDPEVIMNNQKTEVFLDLGEFLDTELLRMHPNHPKVRQMKKSHIYGFFNLPKMIPMSTEDLFSQEYSCIPSLRQVLIFLQFNESEASKAIETSRIKSQLNPHQLHQLFLLFLRFIEISIGRPDIKLFRRLLPDNGDALLGPTDNRVEELDAAGSDGADGAEGSVVGTSGTDSSSAGAGASAAEQVTPPPAPTSSPSVASSAFAAIAAAFTGGSKKTETAASNKPPAAPAGGTAAANGKIVAAEASGSNKQNKSKNEPFKLTPNTASAIFLQMSERLVIEVMINRFINLFPESFHELGYSLMRAHLVSTEINAILEEVCRPMFVARASQCMVCGSEGTMSKCSRCRRAFYCSAACQKAHWVYHKKLCRQVNN